MHLGESGNAQCPYKRSESCQQGCQWMHSSRTALGASTEPGQESRGTGGSSLWLSRDPFLLCPAAASAKPSPGIVYSQPGRRVHLLLWAAWLHICQPKGEGHTWCEKFIPRHWMQNSSCVRAPRRDIYSHWFSLWKPIGFLWLLL